MEKVPDKGNVVDSRVGIKPQSIEDYKNWMKSTLGHDYDSKDLNRYNANVNSTLAAMSQHKFIIALEDELPKWSLEYKQITSSGLFMRPPDLTLTSKPYESAVDKSFRINILWNKQFPKEPKNGWITPANIYSHLNDLIRTCFVCKFIDGPKFVTGKLREFSEARAQQYRIYSQERDEGYYAHHFYAWFDVPIVNSEWIMSTEKICLEIQVTTQLQEILKDLTHQYFEISRIEPMGQDEQQWKWETKSNRFRSAYMCHTLHLLEAIIVDLREGQPQAMLKRKAENDET